MIFTSKNQARLLKSQSKLANLNLQLRQIVVVTRTSLLLTHTSDRVTKECEKFPFILKVPANRSILVNILGQVLRFKALTQDSVLPLVTTPLLRPDSCQSQESLTQPNPPRVLLAEDETIVRHAFARQLQKYTPQLVECEDGLEALDAYRSPKAAFDLVILDYQMPVLDGIAAAQAMRKHESEMQLPHVPILCMSRF